MTDRVVEIRDLATVEPPAPPPPLDTITASIQWVTSSLGLLGGTANQPLRVVLSRPLPVEVYIELAVSGAATIDVDYTLALADPPPEESGHYIRIPAGQTSGFCLLSALDSGVPGTVSAAFEILAYADEELGIQIVPPVLTPELVVSIADAPAAPPGSVFWSFESAALSFDENASTAQTRVRVNLTGAHSHQAGVFLRFWTTDITATGGAQFTPGADYIAFDRLYEVGPNVTTFDLPFRLLDDTVDEVAESFQIHGEVVTPGTNLVNGTTTTTTITINPSDPAPPSVLAFWDGTINAAGNVEATQIEGGALLRLRINLSGPAPQNLQIPISVVAISGDLPRIALAFQGGIFGIASAPVGESFTQVAVTVPVRAGVQATMRYELTIGSGGIGSGFTPGDPNVLELIVLDQPVETPIVAFQAIQQPPITEGSGVDLGITIEVTNALTADLSQPFHVFLNYGGAAQYGTDFRIYQNVPGQGTVESPQAVLFPANTAAQHIILRTVDNAVDEPTESYTITLTNPSGCTIGTPAATTGQILDDDMPGTGEGLKPQFYFASEVIGKGPNATDVNIIVDLGTGVTLGTDIEITLAAYSPNAVESADGGLTGDFWFPDGHVLTIPAHEHYGKLRFAALPDGINNSQKRVVVEMVSVSPSAVSINEYDQQCRWVAILCGAADNEGLVPTPSVPAEALDDFEVYADRIEDLVHGDTYPFPFNPAQAEVVANYGASGILTSYLTFVAADHYWNGPAIAAHLAQKVWLDRNGGSFGTRRVFTDHTSGTEVHYIDPAVKWLDEGVPVYISVYEEPINGPSGRPHSLLFAGDNDPGYGQRTTPVNWGRGIPTGVANQWHPSCTRDLYITARGDQRLYAVEFGQVLKDTAPGSYIQSFVDNLHITGFRFLTDPSQPAVECAQRAMLGRGPLINLSKQRLWWGITHLHDIEWVSTNTSVLADLQFQIRISNPGSWVITNCTATRAVEHFAYLDCVGPICILAYNQSLEGTGYGMVQIVSRNRWRTLNLQGTQMGGNSSGPSHGLLACVENEHVGVQGVGSASDFEIYGHLGYAFFVGNRHRGDRGYNRRFYTMLAAGNSEGQYVADARFCDIASEYAAGYPVLSPDPYFTCRYVEFEHVDINLQGAGSWQGVGIDLAGCWRVVFKTGVAFVSNVAMNSAGGGGNPANGWPFFVFNGPLSVRPNYEAGAIIADALDRPLFGIGYDLPNPVPAGAGVKFRNRGGVNSAPPGGVSFPSGFDAAGAVGAYCGSTRLADHYRFTAPTSAQAFSGLTLVQRNAYDGRDPL